MKHVGRLAAALLVAVIAIALAIYELIPGVTHPRPMGGPTTHPATGSAVLLLVVAVIAGVVAVGAWPRAKPR